MNQTIHLQQLPQLATLFRLFNAGKHLNHLADAALWVALEQQHDAYQQVFSALGYQLSVDPRGFAYFVGTDASPHVSKTSRQLALLLMLVFEQHADAGANLADFMRWRIDAALLNALIKNNHALLEVEQMDSVEALDAVMKSAVFYGFAQVVTDGWQLLAAVWRYLEYFEQVAQKPVHPANSVSLDHDEPNDEQDREDDQH